LKNQLEFSVAFVGFGFPRSFEVYPESILNPELGQIGLKTRFLLPIG